MNRNRFRSGVSRFLAVVLVSIVVVVATPLAQAQTYTVLHSFTGGHLGANPQAELIQDGRGRLYGTTAKGGTHGNGTVFRWTPKTGQLAVLHRFIGAADGANPLAGLVRDSAGSLYGTTAKGGDLNLGTVFKLDSTGAHTILHSFTGDEVDGANPVATLLRDRKGDLYGTTAYGGREDRFCRGSCGTVFKVDAGGNYSVIHRFTPAQGKHPQAGLISDELGNLYGTTFDGGRSTCGLLFKMTKRGKETKLHSFYYQGPGVESAAALVRDRAGNLYGTTLYYDLHRHRGWHSEGYGVVFKLDTAGNYSALYTFTGGPDGGSPYAALILDVNGNLYGTTSGGGSGYGVVFKLDGTGNYTVLHTFTGEDGAYPHSTLTLDKAGNIFGTTYNGGAYNAGVLFEITP